MTDAHTPGPWRAAAFDIEELHTIWSAKDAPIPGILIARTCFAPASEANAALIARAPTLAAEVEALKAEKSALSAALDDEIANFTAQVSALKARVASLEAENGDLRERLKPRHFWPEADPEQGYDSMGDLVDAVGCTAGERVVQFEAMRAAFLPNVWVVAHTDDNDMWVISEHDTEAEADAALSRIGGRAK